MVNLNNLPSRCRWPPPNKGGMVFEGVIQATTESYTIQETLFIQQISASPLWQDETKVQPHSSLERAHLINASQRHNLLQIFQNDN